MATGWPSQNQNAATTTADPASKLKPRRIDRSGVRGTVASRLIARRPRCQDRRKAHPFVASGIQTLDKTAGPRQVSPPGFCAKKPLTGLAAGKWLGKRFLGQQAF